MWLIATVMVLPWTSKQGFGNSLHLRQEEVHDATGLRLAAELVQDRWLGTLGGMRHSLQPRFCPGNFQNSST